MPKDLISISDVPCCPEISKDPCCDKLQFTYRLVSRQTDIPVEIVITAELERCPGPLALGRRRLFDDAAAGRKSAALYCKPQQPLHL